MADARIIRAERRRLKALVAVVPRTLAAEPVHECTKEPDGFRRAHLDRFAAADGSLGYSEVDWRQPTALIIGGEADGGGPEAARLAHGRVSIPMHAATESLNAAVAAGVLLFAAAQARADRR